MAAGREAGASCGAGSAGRGTSRSTARCGHRGCPRPSCPPRGSASAPGVPSASLRWGSECGSAGCGSRLAPSAQGAGSGGEGEGLGSGRRSGGPVVGRGHRSLRCAPARAAAAILPEARWVGAKRHPSLRSSGVGCVPDEVQQVLVEPLGVGHEVAPGRWGVAGAALARRGSGRRLLRRSGTKVPLISSARATSTPVETREVDEYGPPDASSACPHPGRASVIRGPVV